MEKIRETNKIIKVDELEYIKSFLTSKFTKLYKFVTEKDFLSKNQFVKLSLDKNAKEYFVKIMTELNEEMLKIGIASESTIPFSFDKLTNHLAVASQRDRLYVKFLDHKDDDLYKASVNLEELLYLKSSTKDDHSDILLHKHKSDYILKKKLNNFHLFALSYFMVKLYERERKKQKVIYDDGEEEQEESIEIKRPSFRRTNLQFRKAIDFSKLIKLAIKNVNFAKK